MLAPLAGSGTRILVCTEGVFSADGDFGKLDRIVPVAKRAGLDGSVMSFPAVPVGEARVRLFATSEHTEAQIDRCAAIIRKAADELGFARTERPS